MSPSMVYAQAHTNARAHKHTHTQRETRTRVRVHTRTHKGKNTHTPTSKRTRSRALIYTHTHFTQRPLSWDIVITSVTTLVGSFPTCIAPAWKAHGARPSNRYKKNYGRMCINIEASRGVKAATRPHRSAVQYKARHFAAMKFARKRSQWRKKGTRRRRGKGRERNTCAPSISFGANSERQSFVRCTLS
ncbi:hypothetical protein EVAR_68539_1 [Eumeta japonica]|uniref:Uncharacterized protein n=1 Tax=Eumeta variegata TaxID=151549 RepID=A0A4C1ZUS8_EUMVA|nr:hypothetical protein EVAR_68539_1 [Eumeta japonica]